MECTARPYHSLLSGSWFKLIGGASLQNLPTLHNLALAYTLAGADCIDVCADPAVIDQVQRAIKLALQSAGLDDSQSPFLMVSLNDGSDPHFRKAQFPSSRCPSDCSRPCLRICPVGAISETGVNPDYCYGCGRCGPVCPIGLIEFAVWEQPSETIGLLLAPCALDAVEVHTHVGNLDGFRRLWQGLAPVLPRLKLFAVSFPDEPGMREHLANLWQIIEASTLTEMAKQHLVWQIDGLPMSGDLAPGTARSAVSFAERVQTWGLPGHLQLAGGTNDTSVKLAQARQLQISGIGYGSFARRLIQAQTESGPLETCPVLLQEAVASARTLVQQLKPYLHQEGDASWLTTLPQST